MNSERTARRRRLLKAGAGIIAGVLLVLVAGAVLRYANMDTLRDTVTGRLAALTGREVVIAGDFSIAPSLTPTVTAEGLSVANAPWGSRPDMLTAERVLVEVQLIPLLLDGAVRIDRVVISGADVLVETGSDGALNWSLARPEPAEETGSRRSGAMSVSDVTVRDSRIVLRRGNGAVETAALERLVWKAEGGGSEIALHAAGRYDDVPFAIDARLAPTGQSGRFTVPLPVHAEVEYGSAVLSAERRTGPQAAADGVLYTMSLRGSDALLPAKIVNRQLPGLDAWSLAAELSLEGETVKVADLRARIEAGNLVVEARGGAVRNLLEGEGISVPISATGSSVAAAGNLLDVALPAVGAYEISGRIAGSIGSLNLEDVDASIGRAETAHIRVADGSVNNILGSRDLRVPFEARGHALATLASHAGWDVAFGPWTARGTVAGTADAPALQQLEMRTTRNGAVIALSGSVKDLGAFSGFDLRMSGEGPRLGVLSPLTGLDLEGDQPFQAAAKVRGGADALRLEDVSARIGDTSVNGAFRIDRSQRDVPQIEGRLSAQRIDVDELWAAAQGSGDPSRAGGDGGGGGHSLQLGWLDRMEADLTVEAREIVAEGRSFRDAQARILLQDGQLGVRDLTARVAGGDVTGDAAIAAGSNAAAEVTLSMNVEDLKVAELVSGALPGQVRGALDVNINIDSRGRTLDALTANLEGEASLFAEEGQLENVPLNRMIPDLDVTRLLPFFRGRDSTVRINCLIGEFDIDSGVARTASMMDTRRMTLFGRGAIDLGQGTLDFTVRPVAKSRKLSQAAVPVDIEGQLFDPDIRPQGRAAVGGAVRGILGGLLVPLNQLTGLFGEEAKSACTEALRQARERAESARPSR